MRPFVGGALAILALQISLHRNVNPIEVQIFSDMVAIAFGGLAVWLVTTGRK